MPEELAVHPRLPVWKTVGSCYRALWNRQVAQMPFIWIIVALGVIEAWIYTNIYAGSKPDYISRSLALHAAAPRWKYMLGGLGLLRTFASTALIVSWLRYMVRGERPTGAYVKLAFWKYLAVNIVAVVIIAIFYVGIFFVTWHYVSKHPPRQLTRVHARNRTCHGTYRCGSYNGSTRNVVTWTVHPEVYRDRLRRPANILWNLIQPDAW